MTNSCQLRGFGEQVPVIIEEVVAKDLKESMGCSLRHRI